MGNVENGAQPQLSKRAQIANPFRAMVFGAMAGEMIADGTAPKAANFARFEPVVDADGRIRALRFVFPPYQVGPYSDGTRTADVPAAVLLPVLAPEYRRLFRGG